MYVLTSRDKTFQHQDCCLLGMLCFVVWWILNDVSEELTASIVDMMSKPVPIAETLG
jgi:hypothetical protein